MDNKPARGATQGVTIVIAIAGTSRRVRAPQGIIILRLWDATCPQQVVRLFIDEVANQRYLYVLSLFNLSFEGGRLI